MVCTWNGIEFASNNQTVLVWLLFAKHFVGLNCVPLTKYCISCKPINSLVNRHENMSHRMSHSSRIHHLLFAFALGFTLATHDMI